MDSRRELGNAEGDLGAGGPAGGAKVGEVLGEDAPTGEAYPGSKQYYIIEDVEDSDKMALLFRSLFEDVPEPKPKKPRRGKIA